MLCMQELRGPSNPHLQNHTLKSRFRSRLSLRSLGRLTRPCRRVIQNRCLFPFQAPPTRARHGPSCNPGAPFYSPAVCPTTGTRRPPGDHLSPAPSPVSLLLAPYRRLQGCRVRFYGAHEKSFGGRRREAEVPAAPRPFCVSRRRRGFAERGKTEEAVLRPPPP